MSFKGDKNQQSLSYMLVLFTSMNINSFKNIKEFIYEAECKQGKAKRKEFELLPPEINIEFYHLVYEQTLKWFTYFRDFTNEFKDKVFIKKQLIDISSFKTMDGVKSEITSLLGEDYQEESKKIQAIYERIKEEYEYMNCGILDSLNFFSLGPRFIYTIGLYKSEEDNKVIEQKI